MKFARSSEKVPKCEKLAFPSAAVVILFIVLPEKFCFYYIIEKNQWEVSRNVAERNRCFGKEPAHNLGYKRKPLLDLEPMQCPPDLLHLKKGVINKCLNQVFSMLPYAINIISYGMKYQHTQNNS